MDVDPVQNQLRHDGVRRQHCSQQSRFPMMQPAHPIIGMHGNGSSFTDTVQRLGTARGAVSQGGHNALFSQQSAESGGTMSFRRKNDLAQSSPRGLRHLRQQTLIRFGNGIQRLCAAVFRRDERAFGKGSEDLCTLGLSPHFPDTAQGRHQTFRLGCHCCGKKGRHAGVQQGL